MKRQFLSIVVITVIFVAVFTSCSEDDGLPYSYSSESTIYSSSNKRILRELMFILKPYMIHEGVKKYVVVSSIDNINILINGQAWGKSSSLAVDVSNINKEVLENFYVRSEPVKYVTKAPFVLSNEILDTAGDYSELLSNYLSLQPGGYICQIEYIEFTDNNGDIHRYYPLIAEYFEVKENTVSAYIGEFEILIN